MRVCKWRNGAGGGGGGLGLLNKPQKAIRADVFPPGLLELISLHLTQLLHFLLSSKHGSAALYGPSRSQQPPTHKPPRKNTQPRRRSHVTVFRTAEIPSRERHSENITPVVKRSSVNVTKTKFAVFYTFLNDQSG